MQNGGYYQSYFQIPSATKAGLYESYTCTSEFSKYSDTSDFYKVLNYEGTSLFSEIDQTGPWDKWNSEDQFDDFENHYWTEVRFHEDLYRNKSTESGLTARGCVAARAVAYSSLERQIAEVEFPDALAWVDTFKYQHTYEIKSGWRLWGDYYATEPIDGKDVERPWEFKLECGDYGCIGSGAVTMGASALALAVSIFAY